MKGIQHLAHARPYRCGGKCGAWHPLLEIVAQMIRKNVGGDVFGKQALARLVYGIPVENTREDLEFEVILRLECFHFLLEVDLIRDLVDLMGSRAKRWGSAMRHVRSGSLGIKFRFPNLPAWLGLTPRDRSARSCCPPNVRK